MRLASLAALFVCCSGFSWGESSDKCAEATKLLGEYRSQATDREKVALEEKIMQLCPDGATGRYILGLTYERGENIDRAIAEYQAAQRLDPAFTKASGNLGLLYLKKNRLDDAAVELTKALQNEQDPRYHRGLASIFVSRKLYSLGLYHCTEALKAFPNDPSLLLGQAESLAGLGQNEQASQTYQKALAVAPGNTSAQLGLAAALYAAGRLDQAIETLKAAAAGDPANKDVHRRLGELYEKKGDTAAADYEAVLAGLPPRQNLAKLQDQLKAAEALLASRDFDKAIPALQAIIKTKPDTAVAHQRLGEALQSAGRDDEAIAAFKEVIRLQGDNEDVHYRLGLLYEKKGLLDEAAVEYRQSLTFAGEGGETRARLADLYASRGSFAAAIDQYRELIKIKGANATYHLKLARVLVSNKSIPEAIVSYREATRLAPDSLEAHQELAALYKKTNQHDEAEQHYREVMRLKKDDVEARNALTAIYVKKKNYDELIKLLKESIDLTPKDPAAHYKLGLVYEFNKDYENAIARYREAVTLKEDHAKALNALGRASMKVGRLTEAKEYLEKAKQADPDLEETSVLLNNIRDEFSGDNGKIKKKKKGKGKKKSGKSAKKSKTTKKGSAGKKGKAKTQ
jgi:tetratricopeptide (TPR) repeat protein